MKIELIEHNIVPTVKDFDSFQELNLRFEFFLIVFGLEIKGKVYQKRNYNWLYLKWQKRTAPE